MESIEILLINQLGDQREDTEYCSRKVRNAALEAEAEAEAEAAATVEAMEDASEE